MAKKSCLRWMQGGAEDVKLNELISNGLTSRLEKADVAWLAFQDEFPGVNQDQFRRALLRCRKGFASTGKIIFLCMQQCLTLKTGSHTATESENEEEEPEDCKPSATVTPNRRTRSAEEAELDFDGDTVNCNLPTLIAPRDHPITQEQRVAVLVLLPSGTKSMELQAPNAFASTKEFKIVHELPEHFTDIEMIIKAMCPGAHSYDPRIFGLRNALRSCRTNVTVLPKKERTVHLPIDVQTASQTWSKASTVITTGALTSMQVVLIDFSAVQENYAHSSTITTITF